MNGPELYPTAVAVRPRVLLQALCNRLLRLPQRGDHLDKICEVKHEKGFAIPPHPLSVPQSVTVMDQRGSQSVQERVSDYQNDLAAPVQKLGGLT